MDSVPVDGVIFVDIGIFVPQSVSRPAIGLGVFEHLRRIGRRALQLRPGIFHHPVIRMLMAVRRLILSRDIPTRRGRVALALAPIVALGSVVYFLASLLVP